MSKTTTFQDNVEPTTGPAQYTYDWATSANWTNGIPTSGDTVDLGSGTFAANDDIGNLSLAVLSQTAVAYGTVNVLPGDSLTIGNLSQGGAAQRLSFEVAGTLVDNSPAQTSPYFAGNYFGVASTGRIIINAAPNGEYEYGTFGGTFAFEHPNTTNSATIVGGGLGYLELPGTAVTGFSYTQGSGLTVSTTAGTYAFPRFQAGQSLGYTSASIDATTGLLSIQLNSSGGTPPPPQAYQSQPTEKATTGPFTNQYLWSDPKNWPNGTVPPSNSDVTDTATMVDDIVDYSVNHLNFVNATSHLYVPGHLTIQYLAVNTYVTIDADSFANWATIPYIVVYHLSGFGGTIGAHGSGAVTEILDTTDPGENYSISQGAELYLNYSLASASSVTFSSGGFLSLAHPGATTSASITGVSGGDTLELPGQTLLSLSYSGSTLSVQTNVSTYTFSNFHFASNVQYTTFLDSSTGLLGVSFESTYTQGDFNGDGKSDQLWRNTTTGDIVDFTMNGPAIANAAYETTLPSNFSLLATGDFNGDGRADQLWQNKTTGDDFIFTMNGAQIANAAYETTLPSNWSFLGAGDFNGDGKADQLWQNKTTLAFYDFTMNGAQITSVDYESTLPSNWAEIATADFNGDGKADQLWQNKSTGDIVDFTMNGATIADASYETTLPSSFALLSTGDFNGDGNADQLWQNKATGDDFIFTMDGPQIASAAYVTTLPSNWLLTSTGDFNGDGKTDLAWQNTSTGTIYDFTMNGAQIASVDVTANLAANYQALA